MADGKSVMENLSHPKVAKTVLKTLPGGGGLMESRVKIAYRGGRGFRGWLESRGWWGFMGSRVSDVGGIGSGVWEVIGVKVWDLGVVGIWGWECRMWGSINSKGMEHIQAAGGLGSRHICKTWITMDQNSLKWCIIIFSQTKCQNFG